ncbi:hypothetical protein TEA_026455 [Camellia sinensis var. sinensis]|uniref:Uncharacterized protein n=1 Tax=Camellia sinensis var. sinensis TaxID=542762 RepID=A0A4S4CXH7_CAMSN|nr:hypothetical protein TEA_026455 [Camellia sinensis var. sinensis]
MFSIRSDRLSLSLRSAIMEHTVIESKPNHFLDDLRLNSSWPELRSFAETIDLNVANSVVHKHTPYVIILLKVADEWPKTHGGSLPSTREEKKEFKELVRARMRAMDEDNYKEAVKVSFKVFAPRGIRLTSSPVWAFDLITEFAVVMMAHAIETASRSSFLLVANGCCLLVCCSCWSAAVGLLLLPPSWLMLAGLLLQQCCCEAAATRCWSAINVCPARTAYAIGLKPADFMPTTQVIRAYDNTSREVMGTVKIQTEEPGDAAINWFDYEESAEATGWLDDQIDVMEESQPEQDPAGARVSAVAGRAGSQDTSPESADAKNSARDLGIMDTGIESAEATGWLEDQPDVVGESQPEQDPAGARVSAVARSQDTSPESAGAKNSTRDLGIMDTGIVERPAVLTQLEQERFEDAERIRKAKGPEGTESAVCTKIENAASMWTESTASASGSEPDSRLPAMKSIQAHQSLGQGHGDATLPFPQALGNFDQTNASSAEARGK